MTVAVVTGGSRGIGAATCRRLAADGWDVCLGYRTDEHAANDVVAWCETAGRRAVAVRADVTSDDDIDALFTAAGNLGPLGALVNNAGISAPAARVDGLDRARVERLVAVNVTGPLLCAGAAVRRMSTRHGGAGGVIVNVGSAASRFGSPNEYVDYAATKGAIDSMTVGLAKEVAGEGIRVMCVRPGMIHTGIHAASGAPDRVEQRRHEVPMGRGGQPDEVAAAIAWLCSDDASYVTGFFLDVSGGR